MDWKENGSKVKLSKKEILWSIASTGIAGLLIWVLSIIA